ncbi:hypothetical protein [Nostoc sp.]
MINYSLSLLSGYAVRAGQYTHRQNDYEPLTTHSPYRALTLDRVSLN